jgi:hypothetical protein
MIINHRKGESYQHAAARTVFKYWLNSSKGKFGPFEWNSQVWEEFPFIKGDSEPVQNMLRYAPSYEEMKAYNVTPVAIADIALEHKGMIIYAIEIVHKHDITRQKIAKLKGLCYALELEIWRIEAHWILSQIGFPLSFPKRYVTRVA